MEAEKAEIFSQKQAVEQEKTGIREELVRVEQEKMDVENEKSGESRSLRVTESEVCPSRMRCVIPEPLACRSCVSLFSLH